MSDHHQALLAFMAGSVCFIFSTIPAVEGFVSARRIVQRLGAALFIFGSLLLW